MSNTIKVNYKYIDGAHFFTSNHPLALGLCVASADPKVAYDEVAVQLTTLLRKNHGLSGVVMPKTPYESFYKWLTEHVQSTEDDIIPVPAAIIDWQANGHRNAA